MGVAGLTPCVVCGGACVQMEATTERLRRDLAISKEREHRALQVKLHNAFMHCPEEACAPAAQCCRPRVASWETHMSHESPASLPTAAPQAQADAERRLAQLQGVRSGAARQRGPAAGSARVAQGEGQEQEGDDGFEDAEAPVSSEEAQVRSVI